MAGLIGLDRQMSYSSRYFPRPGTSSDQPFRRRKFPAILVLGAVVLALGGCGGESSGDGSTPAATADAATPATPATPGPVADAATSVADTSQPVSDTPPAVNNDSPTHNRVVLRRSGQGD
jgi:hypothetical protein